MPGHRLSSFLNARKVYNDLSRTNRSACERSTSGLLRFAFETIASYHHLQLIATVKLRLAVFSAQGTKTGVTFCEFLR
jgi:hypothetical protein